MVLGTLSEIMAFHISNLKVNDPTPGSRDLQYPTGWKLKVMWNLCLLSPYCVFLAGGELTSDLRSSCLLDVSVSYIVGEKWEEEGQFTT